MVDTRDDLGAAPPDAAGHQGAFTRPEDVMQRIEQDVHESPTTSQDPAHPRGRGSAASMWLWGLVFLIIVVFFAFYALGRIG